MTDAEVGLIDTAVSASGLVLEQSYGRVLPCSWMALKPDTADSPVMLRSRVAAVFAAEGGSGLAVRPSTPPSPPADRAVSVPCGGTI